MKKPVLPSGIRYGIDSNGNKICVGSYMGRANIIPQDKNISIKLRMVKLRMSADGAYDEKGAYWGCGQPIYWAESVSEEIGKWIRIFTRAKNRLDAKRIIRQTLPNAKFYN